MGERSCHDCWSAPVNALWVGVDMVKYLLGVLLSVVGGLTFIDNHADFYNVFGGRFFRPLVNPDDPDEGFIPNLMKSSLWWTIFSALGCVIVSFMNDGFLLDLLVINFVLLGMFSLGYLALGRMNEWNLTSFWCTGWFAHVPLRFLVCYTYYACMQECADRFKDDAESVYFILLVVCLLLLVHGFFGVVLYNNESFSWETDEDPTELLPPHRMRLFSWLFTTLGMNTMLFWYCMTNLKEVDGFVEDAALLNFITLLLFATTTCFLKLTSTEEYDNLWLKFVSQKMTKEEYLWVWVLLVSIVSYVVPNLHYGKYTKQINIKDHIFLVVYLSFNFIWSMYGYSIAFFIRSAPVMTQKTKGEADVGKEEDNAEDEKGCCGRIMSICSCSKEEKSEYEEEETGTNSTLGWRTTHITNPFKALMACIWIVFFAPFIPAGLAGFDAYHWFGNFIQKEASDPGNQVVVDRMKNLHWFDWRYIQKGVSHASRIIAFFTYIFALWEDLSLWFILISETFSNIVVSCVTAYGGAFENVAFGTDLDEDVVLFELPVIGRLDIWSIYLFDIISKLSLLIYSTFEDMQNIFEEKDVAAAAEYLTKDDRLSTVKKMLTALLYLMVQVVSKQVQQQGSDSTDLTFSQQWFRASWLKYFGWLMADTFYLIVLMWMFADLDDPAAQKPANWIWGCYAGNLVFAEFLTWALIRKAKLNDEEDQLSWMKKIGSLTILLIFLTTVFTSIQFLTYYLDKPLYIPILIVFSIKGLLFIIGTYTSWVLVFGSREGPDEDEEQTCCFGIKCKTGSDGSSSFGCCCGGSKDSSQSSDVVELGKTIEVEEETKSTREESKQEEEKVEKPKSPLKGAVQDKAKESMDFESLMSEIGI